MHEFEAPPSSPEVGLIVDGKYRLIGLRGEGAMGSVWQAEHIKIGYAVAIKFLHKAIASMKDSRGRFEREAKVAARLGDASRHVARVLDHGVLPTGMPYVVMELLEGEGLDAKIKREKVLALAEASPIISQLSRALEVAHAEGVVHRDLKPANIFLCRDGDGDTTVKLLDFGVAKATLDNVSFATTRAGALIGTPSFMAPEQISLGLTVDARTDLWALAVITYRLVTGEMPFGRGSIEELAARILTVEPKPPSSIVAHLPPALDAWMRRGLAKKQADRFLSAREMAISLATIAANPNVQPVTAPPPPTEAVATRREGAAASDATISSGPPEAADATLASSQRTLHSERAAPVSPHDKKSPAILALLIAGGLASGIGVTFAAARVMQSKAASAPALSVTSTPMPIAPTATTPPTPTLVVSPPTVMAATSATASASPSASASASASAVPATHAHAATSTTKPKSTTTTTSHPAAAPSDDWNSRSQM